MRLTAQHSYSAYHRANVSLYVHDVIVVELEFKVAWHDIHFHSLNFFAAVPKGPSW
jgi:hypothetical protein